MRRQRLYQFPSYSNCLRAQKSPLTKALVKCRHSEQVFAFQQGWEKKAEITIRLGKSSTMKVANVLGQPLGKLEKKKIQMMASNKMTNQVSFYLHSEQNAICLKNSS